MSAIFPILRLLGIRTHRAFRLSLRAIALIAGLAAAYCVSVRLEQQQFERALGIYLIVCISAFVEFVVADVLADRSFPFDTERKLALMEKRLGSEVISTIYSRLADSIGKFRACDRSRISATVHVMAELTSTADQRVREGLLQLSDYVGQQSGKKGRVTLINQGVIGRCARTGKMEYVDFADARDYFSAMVREFGFTKEEARRHTTTARSYLAYPLILSEKVVGVIFYFTTEPQVFPRAADETELDVLGREIVNYLKLAKLV